MSQHRPRTRGGTDRRDAGAVPPRGPATAVAKPRHPSSPCDQQTVEPSCGSGPGIAVAVDPATDHGTIGGISDFETVRTRPLSFPCFVTVTNTIGPDWPPRLVLLSSPGFRGGVGPTIALGEGRGVVAPGFGGHADR
jgi:hypothetical protein